MEIVGKIIQKLPLQTGVSKAGNNWSKQEYVLETQENYPKKVHFDFFGDRANQYDLQEGQLIKLSFDIESREYNGRWYTSIRGWKAEPADAAAAPAPFAGAPADAPMVGGAPVPPAAAPAPASPAAPAANFMEGSAEDNLPF
ncbi:MAG: DUF3127 domain-containing protein [Bacteroidales bacterium]|nr:DUF3127 domain-containing protein [Bacteroidales bacterium]